MYTAWTKDAEALSKCSSGGMFFEFAKQILAEGGKVVGVIWNGLKAEYVITDDVEIIKKMRGSKYVPSNPKNILPQLKVEKGRVLVTALPCHIEAIKKTCNTDNMILCGIECYGVPKAGLFEPHVQKIANGREIKKIVMRDKKASWAIHHVTLRIEFTNGDVYDAHDEYVEAFLSRREIQKRCRSCKHNYKSSYSGSDILIGDYWDKNKRLLNPNGTSEVFINSKKGQCFFNSISSIQKNRVRFYHKIHIDFIIKILWQWRKRQCK
jgi:coenzyme F420-reducing hydrogenase beta subunit